MEARVAVQRLPRLDRVRNRIGAAAAVVLAMAGAVAAQPADAPEAPPTAAPAAEEAPPAAIPTPAPVEAAPVTAAEVAPAIAPKEKVAEKIAEAPVRRARYDIAVLQALDKVTAESLRFEVPVGRPVRWKGLVFTVSACERSAPDEAIEDAIAYLKIESQPRAQPGRPTPPSREAFRGWMFAASPGLHPLEHASYDAWVISCRASRPLTPPVVTRPAPPPRVVAASKPPVAITGSPVPSPTPPDPKR